MRQIAAARALSNDGYAISVYGFEDCTMPDGIFAAKDLKSAITEKNCIVLPLPYAREGKINAPMTKEDIPFNTIIDNAGYAIVMGGKIDEKAYKYAATHNIELIDYYVREELSVLNAVPTAEGAVEIAMRELPTTVFGMECAVTGYGKVGRVLAATLKALGADVTVFARKAEARAWAKVDGCRTDHITAIPAEAGKFSCIFNTVPAVIINECAISAMRKNALIVDLASSPGGVDVGAAEKYGIRYISALSLPGRVAPDSAGEIIAETIKNILVAEEIT